MAHIFISYRRSDSQAVTERIYDHLVLAFGNHKSIFKDVGSIPSGVEFRRHIANQLSECDIQLVIIGRMWLSSADETGQRRLDDPDDLLRLELEAGLRRRLVVIPVLVDGAKMPEKEELPPSLWSLLNRNAAVVGNDPHFRYDIERLILDIKQNLESDCHEETSAKPLSRLQSSRWVISALVVSALLIGFVLFISRGGTFFGTNEPLRNTQTPLITETPNPTLISAVETDFLSAGASNKGWTPRIRILNQITIVSVPAGCFMMGAEGGDTDELPVHEVCLNSFFISQTEVTNAQYKHCVNAGVCEPPRNLEFYDDPAYANYPVVYLTRDQAATFAQWWGGSLPSEAQWEYAARGPERWLYPWGNTFDPARLNYADVSCTNECTIMIDPSYNDGYPQLAPVGSFPSGMSWVGAMDMAGNAWEWVADWYDKDYYASLTPGVRNPIGPLEAGVTNEQLLRGGSWNCNAFETRSSYRAHLTPNIGPHEFGFRVVYNY